MYNFKRVVALGVVSTMILGSSLTAFASEATDQSITTATSFIEGTGSNEAGAALAADRHAFVVSVPTDAAIKDRLAYTIDLDGWIKETKGARYGLNTTSIDDSKGLMFVNYNNGKASGMSNVSSPITITNKGTGPVTVTVTAKWAGIDATNPLPAGATKEDFSGDGDAAKSIYMGMYTNKTGNLTIMPGDNTEKPVAVGVTSSKDQYVTAWDDTNKKYTYALKDNVAASALSSVNVYFTGAANPNVALTYEDNSGANPVKKAKVAPALSVKFVAAENTSNKNGVVTFKSNAYTIGATAEGGLTAGDLTALKIDGKDVFGTTAPQLKPTVSSSGTFTLTAEQIYKAYGYTAKPTDGWVPHVIEFTNADGTFTVEPNKSK